MAFEWLSYCEKRVRPGAAVAFAALPAAVVLTAFQFTGAALLLLAAATAALAVRSRGIAVDKPMAFGIPYLGIGTVALVWLREIPATGRGDVIVLLLLVWASDIGAYLLGRAIGGPKLAPAISPGKTWSGAVGGLGAAVAVGFIAAATLSHGMSPLRAVCFAALISSCQPGRRPVREPVEAAFRRQGFRLARPRPWRPARSAGCVAVRRPGCRRYWR